MLRPRTTFGLLLACAACGTLLWLLHRPAMRRQLEPSGRAGRLFAPALGHAGYLMIEHGGMRIGLRREAETPPRLALSGRAPATARPAWSIVEPFAAPADQVAVLRLLDRLEAAVRRERLTAEELALRELKPADFGLETPAGRIVLSTPAVRAELLVGNRTPFGDGTYVCFAESEDVLVTDADLIHLLPRSLDQLRDRLLYPGDPRRAVTLVLRRPGAPFVKLARDRGAWQILQPVAARAEEEPVRAILETLASTRIEKFVWPPGGTNDVPDAARLSHGGLIGFGLEGDEGGVQIQVWEADDPIGRRFRFGSAAEGLPQCVYALTSDGQSVVAVTSAVLRAAMTPLDTLRDKRVFASVEGAIRAIDIRSATERLALSRSGDEWVMAAPVADQADPVAVARLMEDLLRLRAASLTDGADAVSAVVSNRVAAVDLATERGPHRLLVSVAEPLARLCFTNAAVVFNLPSTNLPAVLTGSVDARVFRSRVVMAVQPHDVRRIAVRRANGAVETVEREADAGWRPASTMETIDRLALDGWMALIANLQAAAVESLQPAAGDVYGLNEPYLEVTVDLRVTDALRRVLRVGRLAPDGGRYAALKGHDTVFVLNAQALRQMEQALLRPAASGSAMP